MNEGNFMENYSNNDNSFEKYYKDGVNCYNNKQYEGL